MPCCKKPQGNWCVLKSGYGVNVTVYSKEKPIHLKSLFWRTSKGLRAYVACNVNRIAARHFEHSVYKGKGLSYRGQVKRKTTFFIIFYPRL